MKSLQPILLQYWLQRAEIFCGGRFLIELSIFNATSSNYQVFIVHFKGNINTFICLALIFYFLAQMLKLPRNTQFSFHESEQTCSHRSILKHGQTCQTQLRCVMFALSASEVETFRLVFQPPRQCHLNTQDDRSIFRHKQAENGLQLRSGLHGLSWTVTDYHRLSWSWTGFRHIVYRQTDRHWYLLNCYRD